MRREVDRSRPGTGAYSVTESRDARCREEAQRIQELSNHWVVMWSAWHQTFTAFSCFSPNRLVLDEPTSAELLDAMRRTEIHHTPTLIGGLEPVNPDAPSPKASTDRKELQR